MRSIITLSFVILSVGSAIYVSIATWNNLLLFPALGEIQNSQTFHVDRLTFVKSLDNSSTLNIEISVQNPSQYSGLKLFAISANLVIYANSTDGIGTVVFPPSGTAQASEMLEIPLGPNSVDTTTLLIHLTSDQTSQIVPFSKNPTFAIVDLRIDISTFLDSVIGTEVYTRTQTVPLTFL